VSADSAHDAIADDDEDAEQLQIASGGTSDALVGGTAIVRDRYRHGRMK
jgi:hypothetical protein